MFSTKNGIGVGSEKVTNTGAPFVTTDNWTTIPYTTLEVISGRIRVTRLPGATYSPVAYQQMNFVIGKTYKFTVSGAWKGTNGAVGLSLRAGYSNTTYASIFYGFTDFPNTTSYYWTATVSTAVVVFYGGYPTNNTYIEFGGLSVREIGALEFFQQPTSIRRPTLSARVNLLEYSEDFNNGYWTRLNSTVTPDATTAPDGTLTADRVASNGMFSYDQVNRAFTLIAGIQYRHSIYIKADTSVQSAVAMYLDGSNMASLDIDWTAGVPAVVNSIGATSITVTPRGSDGWYRIQYDYIPTTTGSYSVSHTPDRTATSKSTFAWGMDLRYTNIGVNLPEYQRIAASDDYDTAGFPFYLRGNGSQCMYTNDIVAGSDAVTVWAGVRRDTDVGTQIVAEFSPTVASNNGSWALYSITNTGGFASNGSAAYVDARAGASTSPATVVLTAASKISKDVDMIMRNNECLAVSGVDQGTGDYGTYKLNLFARDAPNVTPTSFLTGNIYSLAVRFAGSNAKQLSDLTTWSNTKTKAY
jgi:hypothetical protein